MYSLRCSKVKTSRNTSENCLYISGLPHGQERSKNQDESGKTKKIDKSQEKSGFFLIRFYKIFYITVPLK